MRIWKMPIFDEQEDLEQKDCAEKVLINVEPLIVSLNQFRQCLDHLEM